MDKNLVKEKLIEIFKDKLFRDIAKHDNIWEESIFGKSIALLPTEAYFLLIEIEKNFGIRFSYEDISNGKFSTLKDICDSILKLQSKETT
ncbi:hypothetical protein IMSAGC011_01763 [Lachnospiraceae bacterium]|nr:hypothetical protein IMSAGC011_01763 [Lachnospiraceae bacterium]